MRSEGDQARNPPLNGPPTMPALPLHDPRNSLQGRLHSPPVHAIILSHLRDRAYARSSYTSRVTTSLRPAGMSHHRSISTYVGGASNSSRQARNESRHDQETPMHHGKPDRWKVLYMIGKRLLNKTTNRLPNPMCERGHRLASKPYTIQ